MLMELAASLKGAQTVPRPPLVSQPEDEVPVVATGVCTHCQQLLRAPSVSPQFEQSQATPKQLVFDDPSVVVAPTVGEEDPVVAATTLRPSAGASSPGHPSISMAVSQDVDASARRTTDPTPLSPVWEELPVPQNADDATPCEAARRLARFIDEVRIERPPPLIASPPKQVVPIRRHPVVKRSTRIAARPLSHIPTSR
jgi:hypothetical protein